MHLPSGQNDRKSIVAAIIKQIQSILSYCTNKFGKLPDDGTEAKGRTMIFEEIFVHIAESVHL